MLWGFGILIKTLKWGEFLKNFLNINYGYYEYIKGDLGFVVPDTTSGTLLGYHFFLKRKRF